MNTDKRKRRRRKFHSQPKNLILAGLSGAGFSLWNFVAARSIVRAPRSFLRAPTATG
jgi:hypothetical protein